ncbi:transcriptional repressor LexA [Thermoproteota archaeon]
MNIYQDITTKQQRVLAFIKNKISKEGHPPTIREIASWFGFKSTGTVRDYLKILAKKGYIKLNPRKSRAIELVKATAFRIPVLGQITAGVPNLAYEEVDEYLHMENFLPSIERDIFALRVKGDSMVDKHICEGDLAIIKKQALAESGEVVAALLGDEATIKILRKRGDRIFLEPANKKYRPITAEFSIIGKVIATIKQH